MTDDEKPPARRFVLKPMEVVPTDTPARPGDGTAISIPLMHRQNEIAELRSSLGRRDDSAPDPGGAQRGSPFLAPREITPTDPRACPGDGTAISVELILKGNRIAAGTREPEAIALPRRKVSRRTRDFALLMALAGLAVTALMLQLPRTAGTLVMGLVTVAYAGGLLAWIMYGVMDDY